MKMGTGIPQGTTKWNDNFQMKRSKVKVTGCHKPPQKSGVMFTYGLPIKHMLLRLRLHGGRGREFPSIMQSTANTVTATSASLLVLDKSQRLKTGQ